MSSIICPPSSFTSMLGSSHAAHAAYSSTRAAALHACSVVARHQHQLCRLQLSSVAVRAASAASADLTTDASSSPSMPHVSVLLQPILDAFQPLHIRAYVDGTLGAGGHACAIMQAHPEMETLVGIDLDPTAHRIAGEKLQGIQRPSTQVKLFRGNHREVKRFLASMPAPTGCTAGASLYGHVDAMLLDLGVSSMQLDTAERGFSFLRDGRIDMRMDPDAKLSAEDVINTWSEAELGRIIRDYGEEKMWRQVARRIVSRRAEGPITTTKQLADAIGQTQLGGKGGKRSDGKGIHPATRTFQALRITVNDEISQLEKALPDAIHALAPKGRLAIISFHSLEDRAVKRAFSKACGKPTPEDEHHMYGPDKYAFLDALQAQAVGKLVTRKPVTADDAEMKANPRSRSAKLRVLERL